MRGDAPTNNTGAVPRPDPLTDGANSPLAGRIEQYRPAPNYRPNFDAAAPPMFPDLAQLRLAEALAQKIERDRMNQPAPGPYYASRGRR